MHEHALAAAAAMHETARQIAGGAGTRTERTRRHHLLILFVRRPPDIGRMLIADQMPPAPGAADKKARTGKLPDGGTAHKFEDPLADLDTIVTSRYRARTPAGGRGTAIKVNTLPSPLQQRAFELLEGISGM